MILSGSTTFTGGADDYQRVIEPQGLCHAARKITHTSLGHCKLFPTGKAKLDGSADYSLIGFRKARPADHLGRNQNLQLQEVDEVGQG
jgi:hypothetical protein